MVTIQAAEVIDFFAGPGGWDVGMSILGNGSQANSARRPDTIAGPGHHDGSRQNAPNSVRVSVQEGAILQSFPADYPWRGSRTKQYEQVGNAIPPLLAAHIVSAATGIPFPREGVAA